ncbi:MAG: hypothetical protein AVDCRST_MAG50-3362 [uncultured Acidimicrobiales bacterium]|uniref:PNPLA domain-containing protein n=1 Tax=uncultured Acidimicrobiales bacterium TaxID=310071 RepID=A0A6J4J5I0_9ACTN|nr:MAG: hypothetical protein AVDCRST_MAG50-3362 [uncultured Acidimicrobiales bacterium]
MKLGLVLGAGGTVGLAYHAGALRALEQVGGIAPSSADLMVGTSAGSMVATFLRCGWTTDDLWSLALGSHPSLLEQTAEELAQNRAGILAPLWRNPLELGRRAVGSAYVFSRSMVRIPAPMLPSVLGRWFPGGFFAMSEGSQRFTTELPAQWPSAPLWICAVDINTGSRVVFGRDVSATPAQAVRASCAIPGIYPPVRIEGRLLVDGAAYSTTNVDLAGPAGAGCNLIIAVAPMAFDTAPAPRLTTQLSRRRAARSLAGEVASVRAGGAEVLLLRPTPAELRIHGANPMRRDGWEPIARAAYESVATALETERFQRVLRERPAA